MKSLFIFFISLNVYSATQINECGQYEVYGEIKKNKELKAYDFVVNAGSISEYKIHLTSEQERKIISYSDHSLKIKASILKLSPEYQGVFASINSIDYAVPDPAHFNGLGGFVLIKKEKCK